MQVTARMPRVVAVAPPPGSFEPARSDPSIRSHRTGSPFKQQAESPWMLPGIPLNGVVTPGPVATFNSPVLQAHSNHAIATRDSSSRPTTMHHSSSGQYFNTSVVESSAVQSPRFKSLTSSSVPSDRFRSSASYSRSIGESRDIQQSGSWNASSMQDSTRGVSAGFGSNRQNNDPRAGSKQYAAASHSWMKSGDHQEDLSPPPDNIPLTNHDPVQAAHAAAVASTNAKSEPGSKTSVASPMKSLIIRSLITLQKIPEFSHSPPNIVVSHRRPANPIIKRIQTIPSKEQESLWIDAEHDLLSSPRKRARLPKGFVERPDGTICMEMVAPVKRVNFDFMPRVMPMRGGEHVEELYL
eukprot:GHVH01003691.1.p1 GENE.GHVH01003691.1~~GHVH01003691.1.p1  ORF type:complete len:411 (+),score=38.87 GHVH01003691.1:173-1234(+)